MTTSPNDDHAFAERKDPELTKELSDVWSEPAESQKQQTATRDPVPI